ncbi:hypothetical protein JL722_14918 [Aureococcus anophagefferens]|nr:hypothetical protein JL722_14918 [Aureococcus anophagefferens]
MALAAAALGRVVGDAALDVVRVKERFVARPAAGGWRDALVNARFADDDVVFEVQIVHRELLVARRGLPGHAIYNKLRTGAGATAARLRALGVSLDDLVAARCFDASELRAGGASAQELRDAACPRGHPASGLRPEELRVADAADPGALLDAGYAWDDVAEAFDLKRPDKLALLHLMHALKTVAFLKEKRWGSQRPLGEWYGVETDDRGRVDGLGLSNFNFPEGATLPASIGKLDGLASGRRPGRRRRRAVVVDFVGRPPWAWDAAARGATREPEWRLLDPKTGYALEMAKRDGRASVRLRVAGPSKTLARRSYDIEFDLERMIQRNHTATYASSKGPPERRIARFGLGEAPKNLRGLI